MVMAMMASCQDDNGIRKIDEGLPAKLNLEFQVPGSQKVTVTTRGIADVESEINELTLVMFEKVSGRKEVVELTGKLAAQPATPKGGRTYTLTENIPTLSGEYRVYALANYSGTFGGITGLENMSESEIFEAVATNTGQVTQLTGAERYPMSGVSEAVIPPATDADASTSMQIKLRRLTSHIEFIFKNGTGKNNPTFVPQNYRVFHLPAHANLVSKESNILESGQYFNTGKIDVSSQSFEFFMLENVRPAGTGITSYHDRDAWQHNNGIDPKTFTHAPAHSTYVVVEGVYGDTGYHGDVKYTIHLGNFSTSEGSSVSNFTVNRNEYHTYTITVNGVDKIVAEAKVNGVEEQPGAEGNLTAKNNLFILDSHYETVMLKLTQTDINNLKDVSVRLFSPKHQTFTEKKVSALTDADDYKWIQFQKPASISTFSMFKGRTTSGLNSGLGYLTDFVTDPSTYYIKSGDTYYVQVFIDEYVYPGLPLKDYVNTSNRSIVLDPRDPGTSPDGQSIVLNDYAFNISQRSIKSVYTPKQGINIFGIETWDETGAQTAYTDGSNLNKENGFANTQNLYDVSDNKLTSKNKWYTTCGYLTVPETSAKEDHVWNCTTINNAMKACLARNRDENGNGTIDKNEIKWYIPAIDQYYTIWFGENQLKEDTKLFNASQLTDTYNTDDNSKPKLFTSSGTNYLVYWADQGSSFSPRGHLGAGWLSKTHEIRCCRNLPDYDTQPTSPSTHDAGSRIIYVNDIEKIRNVTYTDLYGFHTEREVENLLPRAFEVGEDILIASAFNEDPGTEVTGFRDKINAVTQTPDVAADNMKSAILEKVPTAFNNGWRIPNQCELMLLQKYGYLNQANSGTYISSTWFTVQDFQDGITDRAHPFVYNKTVMNLLPATNAGFGTSVRVRLVRDATPANNSLPDTAYGDGGTAGGIQ